MHLCRIRSPLNNFLCRNPEVLRLIILFLALYCFLLTIYIFISNNDITPYRRNDSNLPTIYVITATYARFVQRAELTRLCITLQHVANVHWIVVEDSPKKEALVEAVLKDCKGVASTHLFATTPPEMKLKRGEPFWLKAKGVNQRNTAFDWLRSQPRDTLAQRGVVYIADDDNTYALRVFDEMRYTKLVSTWPVALSGELPWEGCIANKGHVTGFFAGYKPERPFPVDMAGFAVNLDLLLFHPEARFSYKVPRGYQESLFLGKLNVERHQLEPKAEECTKILVWHTRTMDPLMAIWRRMQEQGVHLPQINDFV